MTRVNVLAAIDHLTYDNKIHGAGRVFFDIVTRIDRERFSIIPCILRREDALKSTFERLGIKVRYFGRTELNALTLLDFLKTIKKEKIHVLHLHQYGSSMFGRIAGIITGLPIILHGHGIDYNYSWYQQIPDSVLAKFTDLALTVSEEVKEIYVTKRRIPATKVIVMPNGISLEEFTQLSLEQSKDLKKRLGLKLDRWIVGTVTRLREEKGNKYLLEAADKVLKLYPKTYFYVAGEGPLLEDLKCIARKLGIVDNVIFAGFCQNISTILSIFDIKVIASLTEGCPKTLLEAMAMGKPIVATKVGGIKDILRDGQTGVLIPPRDPQTMADKIIYLLQRVEERERLGRNAYQESYRYSLETYIRNLERVYEEVSRGSVMLQVDRR